jgi:hypothetical protein
MSSKRRTNCIGLAKLSNYHPTNHYGFQCNWDAICEGSAIQSIRGWTSPTSYVYHEGLTNEALRKGCEAISGDIGALKRHDYALDVLVNVIASLWVFPIDYGVKWL